MSTPREGSVLASYRLERLVGRGGMGSVWLATDTRLERRVALKLLHEDLAADPHFRRRFLSESRLAASLDHPHIIPVFEAGEADGELFIAMRYVEGTTLDQLIREGPLEITRALMLLRGVADALDAAHAAGLVHRDVKPGNILIARTPSGEHAYLADFGLVKRVGDASFSGAGIVGSAGYLAPEQVEGRPVDGRADVYGLGCVLYAAITGRAPFERDTEMATLYAHVSADVPRPSATDPNLAPFDPVIERALAKDAGQRFQTAGALMAAAADAVRAGTTHGFLFADLRGYTAFVDRHGDRAGAALLGRYRDMTRTVIASHQGAEIRTEGDSFYVVFPSASRAVSAAMALVEEAKRDTTIHPDEPITVGVGVHAGETAETAEGPVGGAVNTAARLCAAAGPGEVLVSETVRGLVRTTLPLSFTSRGRRTFKGLAEPVPVYAVGREPRPGARGTGGRVGLGSTLRGGRGSVIALGGGIAAVAIAVVALVGLRAVPGAGAGATPGPSALASGGSTAPTAGGGGETTTTDYIAYGRRAEYIDASVSCFIPDWAQDALAGEIHLVGADGAGDRSITATSGLFAFDPDWSLDGQQIAFVGGDEGGNAIHVERPDGGGSTTLISDPADQYVHLRRPTWSADRRIAWVNADGSLGVGNGDGTDRRRVALDLGSVDPSNKGEPTIQDLDWLPDFRLGVVAIPYVEGEAPETDLRVGDVYTVRADGTGLGAVEGLDGLSVTQARWSPSGDRLALAIRRGDATDVVVVSDGVVTDITPPGDDVTDRDPAWSPDGKQLAFASDRSGTYEIYTVAATGGDAAKVTDTEPTRASCGPTWGTLATPVPAPSPGPSAGLAQVLQRGWLGGGRYRVATFDPPFEVTIPTAWQAWTVQPDDVWVRGFTDATNSDLDVGRISVAFPDGCLQTPTELAPGTAHDLIEWLESHPAITTGTPRPVSVGGAPGIQIDIAGGPGIDCNPGAPRIFLLDLASGHIFVRPDETIRLIAVDVRGTLVLMVPRSSKQGEFTFDADLLDQIVQPVIDSIEFTSP